MNADKHFTHAHRVVLAALLAIVLMGVIVASQAHASTALVALALAST